MSPRLASHFQPIVSLSHQRTVGCEALLRGTDAQGRPVAPLALFAGLDAAAEEALDRQAVRLHLQRFAELREGETMPRWLFVNMRPATFLSVMARSQQALLQSLQALGCAPHDLVIEVTEDSVAGSDRLEDAAQTSRALGCLLALDDFGAGHSNFDRVWRLQPDVVKLDRSLVQRAAREPSAARIVSQMVSLLHECGALVLMEGIETEDETHLALDCDVDLVQGYFFGRPQPALADTTDVPAQLAGIWDRFHERRGSALQMERRQLEPYLRALEQAVPVLRQGASLASACEAFLRLPRAQLCYQLDQQGLQVGAAVVAARCEAPGRRRFAPLHDAAQACWARRPYFLRALEAAGTVQVTRPYLSLQGTGLCVTVSIALGQHPQGAVLCGDVGL